MFATVDLFNTNLERYSAYLMVQDILYLAHRKIRKNFHKQNFPITLFRTGLEEKSVPICMF